MMKFYVFIIAIFSLFFLQVSAQTGEELFKSTCSSCHSINKGRLVGPDLAGIYNKRSTEWLIGFIRSSQQMIKSGDPDAVAVFNEYNKVPMPDNNFTDQQITSIIDYIRQADEVASAPGEEPGVVEAASDTTGISADTTLAGITDTIPVNEEAFSIGKSYFYGTRQFINGAAPCMSCHNINDGSLLGGGKLAIDLTGSYIKLGEAGITAILSNPPFPAMKAAIPGELTGEEISSLNSLLKTYAIKTYFNVPFPRSMAFFALALVIAIFISVLAFLLYDDRNIPEGNILNKKNRTT